MPDTWKLREHAKSNVVVLSCEGDRWVRNTSVCVMAVSSMSHLHLVGPHHGDVAS